MNVRNRRRKVNMGAKTWGGGAIVMRGDYFNEIAFKEVSAKFHSG